VVRSSNLSATLNCFLFLEYLRLHTPNSWTPWRSLASRVFIIGKWWIVKWNVCLLKTYRSCNAGRPWKASSGIVRMALLHSTRSCSKDSPLNGFPFRLWIWLLARSLGTEADKRDARFQTFTAVKIQVEVIRFVTPWRLHPEDGGIKVLRNVCILSQHYTASQTGRPRLH